MNDKSLATILERIRAAENDEEREAQEAELDRLLKAQAREERT